MTPELQAWLGREVHTAVTILIPTPPVALVESAGEFLAIIPFGILTGAWALPRLFKGRTTRMKNSDTPA